ncbi:hypothetical protein E2C01_041158 [Portunus trituberculatus]|uniref:Uncharacterized protein n=1 Tax=Portunus trituberculatus TaxID=210409 RepID=A0A5B7FQX7_PORTR|nr:hypothetical protein [Portunus trituberculatus]
MLTREDQEPNSTTTSGEEQHLSSRVTSEQPKSEGVARVDKPEHLEDMACRSDSAVRLHGLEIIVLVTVTLIYAGVIHKQELNVVCTANTGEEPRVVVARMASSAPAGVTIMQAAPCTRLPLEQNCMLY